MLHFIADNIPADDEIAPVFEALLAWKAQRDLHDISVDAKRGLRQLVTMKREDGSYEGFAPGTPPRCYKREPVTIGRKRNNEPRIVSRWVPDPAYWEQGQLAWQMRVDGYSLAAIHKATGLFKTQDMLTHFFRNEIYRGVFVFSGERLENFVLPLCTEDQWHAVQAMRKMDLANHPERAPRRRRSPYLLSGLIVVGFGRIMPARTLQGTRALEGVLGFEEFLTRVEVDRFDRVIKTPELFEKFLPYAMALGVEKNWAQAFESIVTTAPAWYQGSDLAQFNTRGFTSRMGDMASRAGSTMTSAPRSSGGSGFSSGGSSGGGFGGGGGRGF